ncbi:hypothetical protein [Duganella sp. Root198D2]|uniref:hypothetical protein n=1 Tax=Duganella sp. Root198D2 TaxID=1736489 RepID=UPI0012E3F4B5|nr:hypothetical protein [Duganella sp. Root198D2]
MSEPISHSLPIVGGLLRLAGALVGKKPDLPKRNLRSRITMQGIVTELPDDFPLKIVDEEGRTHRGVYALEVLIWNCGTEQIEPSDFVENAPLRVALSSDSYVIKSEAISDAKELKYEVQKHCGGFVRRIGHSVQGSD